MCLCKTVGAFACSSKPMAAARSGWWLNQVLRETQCPPTNFFFAWHRRQLHQILVPSWLPSDGMAPYSKAERRKVVDCCGMSRSIQRGRGGTEHEYSKSTSPYTYRPPTEIPKSLPLPTPRHRQDMSDNGVDQDQATTEARFGLTYVRQLGTDANQHVVAHVHSAPSGNLRTHAYPPGSISHLVSSFYRACPQSKM